MKLLVKWAICPSDPGFPQNILVSLYDFIFKIILLRQKSNMSHALHGVSYHNQVKDLGRRQCDHLTPLPPGNFGQIELLCLKYNNSKQKTKFGICTVWGCVNYLIRGSLSQY